MSKYYFILLILISVFNVSAQNNQIAIIKYQEAEGYFNNNEFKKAITSLNECEKLLASTNPKILFLKINAQVKLIEMDPLADYEILKNTRINIQNYLKDYEKIPNNQEKYRQIYFMLKSLDQYPISIDDFNLKKVEAAELLRKENESALKRLHSIEFVDSLAKLYKYKRGMTEVEFVAYNPYASQIMKNLYRTNYKDLNTISYHNYTNDPSVISRVRSILFNNDSLNSYDYCLKWEKNSKLETTSYFNKLIEKVREKVDNDYIKFTEDLTYDFSIYTILIPGHNVSVSITRQTSYNKKWQYINIGFH